jgi:hypothetical protein
MDGTIPSPTKILICSAGETSPFYLMIRTGYIFLY